MLRRRIGVALLLFLPLAAAVAVVAAGSMLCAPARHDVGEPPPDLEAQSVRFNGLRGWFVPAGDGAMCALLMHGVRADRRSMVARAQMLKQAGYASLLFDFQAHGESPGEHITFGFVESNNAHAAVALMRSRFGCRKVIAIGQSLGGAAALLGERPIDADLLVLESVYPTIEEAVTNRLERRLGNFGALLTPLLTLQLKPRLNIDAEALRPVEAIGNFHQPVLLMAGTADEHTPIDEARRLYAAANEPKVFWAATGAKHVDLQRFDPDGYRRALFGFLSDYL